MKLRSVGLAPWVMALGVGCLPDNPSVDDTAGTTVSAESSGSADSTAGDEGGGELLGCPAGGCTMLLAVQTLDDRIEVFVPDHPDAAYRGAISIDLKPNECPDCQLGDNGSGRLDEPFGIARAGGFLHVLTGHYPTRDAGGLVSFPLGFFDATTVGTAVPVSEYFVGSQFLDGVVQRSLGEREAIFVHQHASGRLVVGVFNNDLFAGEESWSLPGKLLVIDPTDPSGEIGTVSLDGLDGGACQGASQVITIGPTALAVACDGNERVAILDATSLDGGGTVAEAAAGLGNGFTCPVPGVTMGTKRLRYLAPDGNGGFAVLEGPTPTQPQGSARLWHMAPAECSLQGGGPLELGSGGDWQLGEIVQLPNAGPTWLFAAGSSNPNGVRGVFVARNTGDALELCPSPLPNFESAWEDVNGDALEPFALAVTSDGAHVAVGAGPYIAPASGVGYGKVLWASISGSDPCSLSATVVDLTDGGSGRAPAPDPTDPSTFRRGPNVVVIQEIPG
jgi:hypothetical protein